MLSNIELLHESEFDSCMLDDITTCKHDFVPSVLDDQEILQQFLDSHELPVEEKKEFLIELPPLDATPIEEYLTEDICMQDTLPIYIPMKKTRLRRRKDSIGPVSVEPELSLYERRRQRLSGKGVESLSKITKPQKTVNYFNK